MTDSETSMELVIERTVHQNENLLAAIWRLEVNPKLGLQAQIQRSNGCGEVSKPN